MSLYHTRMLYEYSSTLWAVSSLHQHNQEKVVYVRTKNRDTMILYRTVRLYVILFTLGWINTVVCSTVLYVQPPAARTASLTVLPAAAVWTFPCKHSSKAGGRTPAAPPRETLSPASKARKLHPCIHTSLNCRVIMWEVVHPQ